MKTEEKALVETQGAKTKEKTIKPTVTLKTMAECITRLRKLDLITELEEKVIRDIQREAIIKYMGGQGMEREELIQIIWLIRKLQRYLDEELEDVNYTANEIIEIAENIIKDKETR